MKIVAVDVPAFCAAELVPVHVVVDGTGFVRIADRRVFVWRRLDRYVEVERGAVVAGKTIDPQRIPTAPTAPSPNAPKPRARVHAPKVQGALLVVDLGEP